MPRSERETRFRELLERNHARWAGVARAYAPSASDRDDLLQEIALQVWKSLDRFDGRSSIDTWAYRVSLNTALGWRRKSRTRSQKLQIAATEVDALQAPETDGDTTRRVLDEFLNTLSATDRAVMLLYLDALPQDEAAGVLGMTEGAFRVRLHRLRKRFEATYANQEASDVV